MKKLAAQILAFVQGTTPTTNSHRNAVQNLELEPSKFESMLNLQVTSPRCQQKTVCVVEVDSPVKRNMAGQNLSKLDKKYEFLCSKRKTIKEEDKLSELKFAFSDPVLIVSGESCSHEITEIVEDEPIMKSVAGNANSSLISSVHDQSLISDTTFDDRRLSVVRNSAEQLEFITDESSALEDSWGCF